MAMKNFRLFLFAPGTPFAAGHLAIVTAETPPPVQAVGDTIPKGLRSKMSGGLFFVVASLFFEVASRGSRRAAFGGEQTPALQLGFQLGSTQKASEEAALATGHQFLDKLVGIVGLFENRPHFRDFRRNVFGRSG